MPFYPPPLIHALCTCALSMQPAVKKPKLAVGAPMTAADWLYWENEVVHAAGGQVHLIRQWPPGDSPETP